MVGGGPADGRELGHRTITMTMRYAHLAPGGGAELIKALELGPWQPRANEEESSDEKRGGEAGLSSEPSRNRTYNLRIKSPLLYQLSYGPIVLPAPLRARPG